MKVRILPLYVIITVFLFGAFSKPPGAGELAYSSGYKAGKQCGVSNAQISDYLRSCSHQHTVYWVQDIPGGCNSKAGIEGCSTATVYVVDGIITGHMDVAGICD